MMCLSIAVTVVGTAAYIFQTSRYVQLERIAENVELKEQQIIEENQRIINDIIRLSSINNLEQSVQEYGLIHKRPEEVNLIRLAKEH
ncbi:MAG: hypothetical protein LBQ77_07965 [Treponema sp.]|jgi:hypothetical protein|nr:hypothetical protein [Treponema sp.]